MPDTPPPPRTGYSPPSMWTLLLSFLRTRLEWLVWTRFPRAWLHALQERRVRAHLRWLLPRSRELAERLGDRPLEQWREMPLTDKASMMARWTELVTVPVTREQAFEVALRAESDRDFSQEIAGYTVGLSSGTTGTRGLFLASAAERMEWAGAAIAKVLPDRWPGLRAQRVAFFLRANSKLYESVGGRRIRFVFFDLFRPMSEHLPPLQELDPTILIAPPSVLGLLACARLEGRLQIAPHTVVSVAEVLELDDAEKIRRAFGPIVHQVYQATEGLLGSTCREGTLHLAEDVLLFEAEPCGPDGRFHPILTDYRRRSQPIVRYRLDDVLVPRQTPCPCGSAMLAIERIEGRSDDALLLEGERGHVRIFPDFVRRAVMLSSPGIADWRVVQLDQSTVSLWVKPEPLFEPAAQALRALASQQGSLPVVVVPANSPQPVPGAKSRRVCGLARA
jgi:putative adenylate-forming enzyme